MKQFFKFMFASMVGFFLSFLIVFFILMGIIASIATFAKKEPVTVSPNSILHLKLNTEIVDRTTDNPAEAFDLLTFAPTRAIGLNELLRNIRKAKEDENIKGIFLDVTFTQTGWATLAEIREQLIDFKNTGKFIIAYSEYMGQGAYYLASVADQVYLSPEGIIDFRGLNAEVAFIKNLLEKIGVEPQLIRHGKFKSAGEPLIMEQLSPENRQQITSYINSIWNSVLKDISESRSLTINELNRIADAFQTRTPELALEAKIIDGILYRDEAIDNIKERLGVDKDKKINLVSYNRYQRAPLPDSMLPQRSRDKIAVIYGSGNMVLGNGTDRNIGADRFAAAIREARRDTTVKAIVLRINSGGGISMAGEIILREAMLASEAKPFIVSMGNIAASAAYYISCYADEIIANPKTLTGSIGVFAVVPNMKNLFNSKLGITFDNVKTNALSDFGSVSRPLNRTERELLQDNVDRVYDTFINKVADGRGLPLAAVDSIAQGKVWSGVDAKRVGLIDEFGGLNYAIERAAALAEIERYRVVEYPVQKDFLQRIRESFDMMEMRILKARLGDAWEIYEQTQKVGEYSGVLMRLPYDITIE
jgi:protease IV